MTANPTRFISYEAALQIGRRLLGGAFLIRDEGLLQSALARPSVSLYGREAYPTLDDKAGALLESLIGNHPLVDGNKRFGWICVRYLYVLNGWDLVAPGADSAEQFILAVASGSIDRVEIARTLAEWVHPVATGS